MELLYVLLVLLLVTRTLGEVAARFGQPVLVGELLSGVLLGLLVRNFDETFPVLAELSGNRVFDAVTDLAILFLMLLAGIEMRPKDIQRATGVALPVAVGGLLVPLAMGLTLGYLSLPGSDWRTAQMLYLGVALSVTAVPITLATLLELGKQHSRVGTVIVSAAVFDDVMGLFLLAILTSLLGKGSVPDAATLVQLSVSVLAFFAVTAAMGLYVFPWVGRLARRLRVKHIELSLLMAWALAFSVLADALGLHFVLGAYAAGLFFTKRTIDDTVHHDVHQQVEAMTLGFFAPFFFASIGMRVDMAAVVNVPGFVATLVGAAVVGKLSGSGLAAYLCGLSPREALAIGVGMNTRGAVELIIADIALRAGLFDHPQPPHPVVANLFSAVAIMAVCAAVVSPIGLRAVLGRK